jgi:uncharacterized protein YjiS (DUF1127 family)
MASLEQVWREWRALSRADRARFLMMLREAYGREREMARRRNGGGATHDAKVESLRDLTLSEADFRQAAPLVRLTRAGLAKALMSDFEG